MVSAGSENGSLFVSGLGLFDGHPVLDTIHTVYIVGEFGGQILFGNVVGFALQCDVAIVCLDLGINSARRAVKQQR